MFQDILETDLLKFQICWNEQIDFFPPVLTILRLFTITVHRPKWRAVLWTLNGKSSKESSNSKELGVGRRWFSKLFSICTEVWEVGRLVHVTIRQPVPACLAQFLIASKQFRILILKKLDEFQEKFRRRFSKEWSVIHVWSSLWSVIIALIKCI